VVIPALHEGDNLRRLLPELASTLRDLNLSYEVLVVSVSDDTATIQAAESNGARFLAQRRPGYGGALVRGFEEATAEYILTMDGDLSHSAGFVQTLWQARREAEVSIASRYVPGGQAKMSRYRYMLSWVANWFFGKGLDVPIRDLSSGFRLYRSSVIAAQRISANDFDILQQLIVQAYIEGWHVQELPFTYEPRVHGHSHARVLRVGLAYLKQFGRLWMVRNSILAADYDDRAHDSRIVLQRYWQRARHRFVTELFHGEGAVLDVGCGSSRIIGDLPPGSVAVDVLLRKLRYARRFGKPLVHGSGFALPFADAAFPCVLCSQVIEHVPKTSPILDELCRVLKPGGRLVLGTPDYANWQWVLMERLYGLVPGGYADEHIAHYTHDELLRIMEARGFVYEDERYIMRGELIMAFRKKDR